ncbi:LuxR C-terminal-related transcriptional regulator [Rhodobacter maris]|uniref:DNA-binding CsgD family transcriptional regulator n=1 Tax=Rhodobacter maris TaxID=446682 RepID=A0A285S814_9RHOB|nr:LuxR C-terminal-related transcriptional regulator [Rhodobacter maris]SOC03318.1 DNA-binding CsgD family transcriptional regulator [Rhodobacter maris]
MFEEAPDRWQHPRMQPEPQANDLVCEIYHTALNPEDYERLVDTALGALALTDTEPSEDGPEFPGARPIDPVMAARHVAQAGTILGQSAPFPELEKLFALYRHLPAVLVAPNGLVLHANPRALQLLQGSVCLPLACSGAFSGALSGTVTRRIPLRYEGTQDAVFTVLFDPESQARLAAELAQSFDLTEAETDVLRLSLQCLGRKEIAQRRGVSPETVKKQIERILTKTGAGSQMALSQLGAALWRDPGVPDPATNDPGTAPLPYFPDERSFLHRGRRLSYRVFGAPEGQALVFFHGTYGFCRWPQAAEAEAARHGLKVIVPIRAGYGNSAPLSAGADAPGAIFADIAAILAREGVTRAPLVTLENDSALGFGFARAFPEMVSGMIAFAGVLPVTRKAQYRRMDKWHRFVVGTAHYTPALIPLVAQGGFHFAARIGREEFVRQVYAGSPPDVALLTEPEARAAILDGTRVALSPRHLAHRAYALEMQAFARGEWQKAVAALRGRLPVVFVNGATDPIAPPATIAEFRADYPWITFELLQDAGQFVFFRHWGRLFAHLPAIVPRED